MDTLNEFHINGILAFVGRRHELSAIIEFWRGVFAATKLRAMMLEGEAGIGKSRLLEQAVGTITGLGASVVHIKYYPETTASLPHWEPGHCEEQDHHERSLLKIRSLIRVP
ncbi:MAG TPA: hypothetical protein VHI13_15155 [Candidatus Kapabacteria bacterium]|nr:hypothetical protein [Candidatus Kapabacteria bacterium]